MTNKRLPTGGVGSYVQPLWLVNQDILHFIVQRIGAPLKIISVESLITVPNCDMKFSKRTTAFENLKPWLRGAKWSEKNYPIRITQLRPN